MTSPTALATTSTDNQAQMSLWEIYRALASDIGTTGLDAGETRPERIPIEKFLTAAEVAAIIGVTTDWVYEQAKLWERTSGLRGLPSYKIAGARRFRLSEIEEALAAGREARIRRASN